jgi:hypothetical protein
MLGPRNVAYFEIEELNVRHIPGTKHTAADGLSRRLRTESDDVDEEYEVNIDDFIDAEINAFRVMPIAAGDL